MGVFSAKQGPNMDAKRNTFDLSFSNNLTMQFGKIYPVFVKPCDPGDSFNIKASFGLNFLPTVYPVQTPMKAYLHFFYCRNRTVWDDFMNFYTMKDRAGQNLGSSELIPPYLNTSVQPIGASELSDYMGIPILDYPGYISVKEEINIVPQTNIPKNGTIKSFCPGALTTLSLDSGVTMTYGWNSNAQTVSLPAQSPDIYPIFWGAAPSGMKGQSVRAYFDGYQYDTETPTSFSFRSSFAFVSGTEFNAGVDWSTIGASIEAELSESIKNGASVSVSVPVFNTNGNAIAYIDYARFTSALDFSFDIKKSADGIISCNLTFSGEGFPNIKFVDGISDNVIAYIGSPTLIISSSGRYYRSFNNSIGLNTNTLVALRGITALAKSNLHEESASINFSWHKRNTGEVQSPYYKTSNPDGIRLSSLPFRHYEAIYNYFYRDNRNNPLRDDAGNPVYNEVLLNTKGGPEPVKFLWRYHNWEQDFLTTCVQEPQLGIAPLVGISSLGEATFSNEDGSTTRVQLTYGEDGDTVTGWKASDGIDAPVAQSLIQMASQGISISDFRNVNAFQTWLEVQMRKTLRFGDSIQGHFNVNPRYDDYLYPEFIGGVTQDVDTYQVNQTTPTADFPLGSYAGQAICKGSVPRFISRFCDEPGYIIGLLSLVPRPVYSQILPKHFLRHETLDYHFPEFNNISFQPITYREVCPVQAYNEDPQLLDKVFGYQRPWYDLISSIDEAHGQFLTTLQGFILRREFLGRPELSSRFLEVHPEDLNDIFATQMTDSNDVVLGQLYFDVKKKTTISKFGIPSLQV
uniref:Major capsid protein n=1 Tax=Dulem virus 249 TaxID=3145726 RepID=A0AAU8AWT7_9VIRU